MEVGPATGTSLIALRVDPGGPTLPLRRRRAARQGGRQQVRRRGERSVMTTRFTELVGCSVPIQKAPMGGGPAPELAAAVAEAGGVVTVTALGTTAEALVRRLDELSGRTDGVLAVNFLTEEVDPEAVLAAAERVRLVDFFWLPPRPRLVELVHRAGALAAWQVGSVDEARAAADAGCDVLAVQGLEAG